MIPDERMDGGCFCGAVRFSAQAPSKWCAHCHCSMCRMDDRVDRLPQANVFFDQHVDWMPIDDTLKKIDG